MDEMKTLRERDIELEKLWKQFEDLPIDPDTEKIEEPFLSFPAGTDREDIWHWFDERHSKGISYLRSMRKAVKTHTRCLDSSSRKFRSG